MLWTLVHNTVLKRALSTQFTVKHLQQLRLSSGHFPPSHTTEAHQHLLASLTSGPKWQTASSSDCHREAVSQQLRKHQKIKHTVHVMIQVFGVIDWIAGLLTPSALKKCIVFIFKVKTSLRNVGNQQPCHSTECSWPESSTSMLLKPQISHTVHVLVCPLYWYLSSPFNVFCSSLITHTNVIHFTVTFTVLKLKPRHVSDITCPSPGRTTRTQFW
jgi:hypothetical protein